jgi:phenylpyruvate tautomerase PptA (4-oxalocrotonate tautomerase family)
MPVLNLHTNVAIENKDNLLKQTSNVVAQALGKPESYVMVRIHDNEAMSFAGTTDPLAYVELKSLGLTTGQTGKLSNTLCTFIEAKLGISAARIYIEFAAPERAMFGWNKGTF